MALTPVSPPSNPRPPFYPTASESFAAVLLDSKRVLLVDRFNARALLLIAMATFEVSVDIEKTKKVRRRLPIL